MNYKQTKNSVEDNQRRDVTHTPCHVFKLTDYPESYLVTPAVSCVCRGKLTRPTVNVLGERSRVGL